MFSVKCTFLALYKITKGKIWSNIHWTLIKHTRNMTVKINCNQMFGVPMHERMSEVIKCNNH